MPGATSIFEPRVEPEYVFRPARRHVAVEAVRSEFQASLQHGTLRPDYQASVRLFDIPEHPDTDRQLQPMRDHGPGGGTPG